MIQRITLFCLLLSATSCVTYKDLILFRKTETSLPEIPPLSTPKNIDLVIQPDDALSINVSCIDPQLAVPFNLVDMRTAGYIQPGSPMVSFLVDNKGFIDFPVIGRINVANKTIPQLHDTLVNRIKPYIKEPSINIRRVNFRVTVLGEVLKPGSYNINSERITLLEAIGLAGDLTPYSDRQKIMVVREENGKTTFGKIDLQSTDFFSSPYFFLHQNDVVYIDPKKSKKSTVNDPASKYLSWASAGLSAASAIITVLVLYKR
jgi:polysaccharide biosynthesis/export protein